MGGLWDKIPQQDFALKMQRGGGLCARGSVFAGHYGITFLRYKNVENAVAVSYSRMYICAVFALVVCVRAY